MDCDIWLVAAAGYGAVDASMDPELARVLSRHHHLATTTGGEMSYEYPFIPPLHAALQESSALVQQTLAAMEAAVAALHIMTVPGVPAHGKASLGGKDSRVHAFAAATAASRTSSCSSVVFTQI